MNFFATAFAQEATTATATAAAQPNPLMSFVPFVLVFVIFYFLMIKPQKKKLEEEKKFLTTLQKGEEVFTKSGVIGTIVGLTDKIVTLEVAEGVKMKFLRGQVGGSAKAIFGKEVAETK